MKLYKDIDGKVYGFEDDGSQDHLITETMLPYSIPLPVREDVVSGVWARIKSERDRRIQAGGYKAGAKWYHSDTFSRTQQIGLVMRGDNIPAGTEWKTMDGSFVLMSPVLAGQIFAAAVASDIATFSAAEAHRAAMEAIADPAAYDFSTGWPQIYSDTLTGE